MERLRGAYDIDAFVGQIHIAVAAAHGNEAFVPGEFFLGLPAHVAVRLHREHLVPAFEKLLRKSSRARADVRENASRADVQRVFQIFEKPAAYFGLAFA